MKAYPKLVATVLLACVISSSLAAPLGSAVSFQGRLMESGQPASGVYDIRIALFADAEGGGPVGPILTNLDTTVSGGLFSTTLDFGVVPFDGTAYWLELGVRPAGSADPFTLLSPRQALTAAPYALYASSSGAAPAEGNTLDQAYDQGGPGAGSIIHADSGAVRILGTDGLSISGSVHIGVRSDNPGAPLTIRSSAPPPLALDNWTVFGANSLNSYWSSFDTVGAALRLNNGSSGDVLLAHGGGDVVVAGGSGNVTLAQGGGNVGIGTTNPPAAKLQIVGEPGTDGIVFPDNTLQTTAAGGSASVPIGTIIDWWRPDDSFPFPDGYLSCDGSVINDPDSLFNGLTLPDLRGRFIMGASHPMFFGQIGGQYEHSHRIAAGGTTSSASLELGSSDSNFIVAVGPGVEVAQRGHSHSVPAHNHDLTTLDTDTKFHQPPYMILFKLMRIR